MSDYRVTMKIRNARILNIIEELGYKPGKILSDKIGISYAVLLEYINCVRVPFDENNNLRACAEKLCVFFNKLPNVLWSQKWMVQNLV